MIARAVLMVLLTVIMTENVMADEVPPPPVEAPDGFRWVLNEPYSDEFNGDALDNHKWHDTYPGWKGRVPGLFVPQSVSVSDGYLRIKSTVLNPSQGDEGEWTIACGAIQTKAQEASFGYYETRVKASNISTSTTFWLKNPRGKGERPFKSTELDILECIGNAQRWEAFGNHMMSNTHITYLTEDKEAEPLNVKKGERTPIGSPVHEDFHTYGCWWVDANHMKFYLDGELVHEISYSPEEDGLPDAGALDQLMFVNLVCEIYDWEVTPTPEELSDDSRNTTLYDYVRSYELVPVDEGE